MSLVTTILVAINIVIFLLMYKANPAYLWEPSTSLMLPAGATYGPLVFEGQTWRMVSSSFVHIGVFHIAMNMFALLNIGSSIERQIGALKYLIIYLISMITSALLSIYAQPYSISAGASGAIFGLLGAQLVGITALWKVLKKTELISMFLTDAIWIGLYIGIGFFIPHLDSYGHLGGIIGGILAAIALLPLTSNNKLPNVFNIAAVAALCFLVFGAYQLTEAKIKQAASTMTPAQIEAIDSMRKKENRPFWFSTNFSSPTGLLGPACLQVADYQTALSMANEGVTLQSNDGNAYYTRALVEEKFNHHLEALADVTKALSLKPGEYDFLILRGRIKLAMRKADEALSDAHLALKEERKNHTEAFDLLGCCYLTKGNPKEAVASFNKAIHDDDHSGPAFYHRAMAHEKLGEKIKAEQDKIRAQEQNYVPTSNDSLK
jgi:rhomboid protease GluP